MIPYDSQGVYDSIRLSYQDDIKIILKFNLFQFKLN